MEEIKKITNREVKILKMVNHRNIIHLKQTFRRKEKLHLVFEFGGKTILDIMKEAGGGIKVKFNLISDIQDQRILVLALQGTQLSALQGYYSSRFETRESTGGRVRRSI